MKIHKNHFLETYLFIQLLQHVENDCISQREIACDLGVAVGLVNKYLNKFVAEGFLKVSHSTTNAKRHSITEEGHYQRRYLHYKHSAELYLFMKILQHDFNELFEAIRAFGWKEVVFCGVGFTAEIALGSLQKNNLQLIAIVDSGKYCPKFCGRKVEDLTHPLFKVDVPLIITSIERQQILLTKLKNHGVTEDLIYYPQTNNIDGSIAEQFFYADISYLAELIEPTSKPSKSSETSPF